MSPLGPRCSVSPPLCLAVDFTVPFDSPVGNLGFGQTAVRSGAPTLPVVGVRGSPSAETTAWCSEESIANDSADRAVPDLADVGSRVRLRRNIDRDPLTTAVRIRNLIAALRSRSQPLRYRPAMFLDERFLHLPRSSTSRIARPNHLHPMGPIEVVDADRRRGGGAWSSAYAGSKVARVPRVRSTSHSGSTVSVIGARAAVGLGRSLTTILARATAFESLGQLEAVPVPVPRPPIGLARYGWEVAVIWW